MANTLPDAIRAGLRELGWGDQSEGSAKNALAAGVWLGILVGLLEATQHWVFRHDPVILMIDKVPAHIFWVAPVLQILINLLLVCVCLILPVLRKKWPPEYLAALLCTFIGVYGLMTLTRKIHTIGAVMLAAGASVALVRGLRTYRPWNRLRRSLPYGLVALALIAAGIYAEEFIAEKRMLAKLGPAPRTPNVLFIVLDTVRADHFSLHGYPRATTPNIDHWAQQGVVFDNAWSTTSWTFPSHASMFTGLPTYQHGADRNTRFEPRTTTLAEFLRDRGYRTGAFIGNDIWLSPEHGFDIGFTHFRVYNPFTIASRTVWGRKIRSTLTERFDLYHLPIRRSAEDVNANLIDWIDQDRSRPFFAFLNYFDAHDPYWPPAHGRSFDGETPPELLASQEKLKATLNIYDAEIAFMDEQIGSLREELRRRGLERDTILILTCDHGESLGDHKQPQHGKTLYQEVMRVALIIVAPGRAPAGRRVESAAVSVQQIPATIAELLGFASGSPFPGPSLAGHFNAGEGDAGREETVLGELRFIGGALAMKSLVSRDYQYIWNAENGKEELFRLRDDPRQLKDLASDQQFQPELDRFREKLRAIFPSLPIPPPGSGPTR